MKLLRKLLLPLVPLYYVITWWRNLLYDVDVLHAKSYSVPIISVGNLSVGGSGKTPMVEYLIGLLSDTYQLATLSRGYGRDSNGFVLASKGNSSKSLGDEPYQFFRKYPNIKVAVDSDRRRGIEELMQLNPIPDLIILDDAFQHRRVKPGLSLLLTPFHKPYTHDICLPTGDLREPRSGASRADIVVVTKCPHNMTDVQANAMLRDIQPDERQEVFFSFIAYADHVVSSNGKALPLEELKVRPFKLVTGIADPSPLLNFLNEQQLQFEHEAYPDHHPFSTKDVHKWGRELVVTTEKDYGRLLGLIDEEAEVYYLPMAFKFWRADAFNRQIMEYLDAAKPKSE